MIILIYALRRGFNSSDFYPCGAILDIYYLFIKFLFNKLNNSLFLFKGRPLGPLPH
jgi:hypothetical protein